MKSFPKAYLSYRLLSGALTPLATVHAWYQGRKAGDADYLPQRLGRNFSKRNDYPLWIHAASVGEVKAVMPLIQRLQSDYPQIPLVVTTQTSTSAKLIKSNPTLSHYYLPFDASCPVHRFFEAICPRAGLIVETEIWPNLFSCAAQKNIPLVLINGRLSHRTLQAPGWLQQQYRHALNQVTAVLAKSSQDAAGFITLGAAAEKVRVVGNLKFAAVEKEIPHAPNLIQRPYWLAASTHADEEIELALAFASHPSTPLLVIAPRHPNRTQAIQDQLREAQISFAVRSLNQPIVDATRVYLADTLGEMTALMQHAELVFMGGSLGQVGGHNLLEPAGLGKAIVTGFSYENFVEEVELLRTEKALRVGANLAEVCKEILDLLCQPDELHSMGQRARQAVLRQNTILDQYLVELSTLIPLQQETPIDIQKMKSGSS